MNQVFIRSDQLADKIHEIKLLMPEWKVLFTLDGRMATDEIAAFLEISPDQVEKSVQHLQELEVIQQSGPASQDTSEPVDESVPEFTAEEPELTIPESTETEDITSEITEEPATPEFMEETQATEETKEIDESEESEESEKMAGFPTISEEVTEDTPIASKDESAMGEFEEEVSEEMPEAEHLEELNLEEESVESEAETEEDLDSLINDLLKEEVVTDENDEGPKILDEEEIAGIDTEVDFSEEPSATADDEQLQETENLDLDAEFDSPAVESTTSEELDEQVADVETEEEPAELAEQVVEEVVSATPKAEGHKTILVVDDSIVIRKMVEIALENESYEIVSVATGKDAFSYLDSKNPDLVILDIMLPDVNGLDILKAIKASKKIPVVMLSAKDTPKETSQAKDLGADDFIPKPFRDEELVSKIHELIGQ